MEIPLSVFLWISSCQQLKKEKENEDCKFSKIQCCQRSLHKDNFLFDQYQAEVSYEDNL